MKKYAWGDFRGDRRKEKMGGVDAFFWEKKILESKLSDPLAICTIFICAIFEIWFFPFLDYTNIKVELN